VDRFVDVSRDFPGKAGLQAQIGIGIRKVRVVLEIDSTQGPAQPGEGVFLNGEPVGTITSAAWGYRTQKNLAMAYVAPEHSGAGKMLEILLLGKLEKAAVRELCQFDPQNLIPSGRA
jgi:dimethylglycine dehydrogenase